METLTDRKGRVTGRWLAENHPGYEAVIDVQRWNGWACPRFTEEVARQIAADVNADSFSDVHISIHNDPVEFVEHPATMTEDEAESDPLGPLTDVTGADDDGLFPLGAYAWCWEEKS